MSRLNTHSNTIAAVQFLRSGMFSADATAWWSRRQAGAVPALPGVPVAGAIPIRRPIARHGGDPRGHANSGLSSRRTKRAVGLAEISDYRGACTSRATLG